MIPNTTAYEGALNNASLDAGDIRQIFAPHKFLPDFLQYILTDSCQEPAGNLSPTT